MPSKKKATSRSKRKRPAPKPAAAAMVETVVTPKPIDLKQQLQWAHAESERTTRWRRQVEDERDGLLHLIAVAERHNAITRLESDGERY